MKPGWLAVRRKTAAGCSNGWTNTSTPTPGSTGSNCRTSGAARRRRCSSTSTVIPIRAASTGPGCGSSMKRTSRAATGPRSTSAGSCPTTSRSCGAIARPDRTGSAASRRPRHGVTAPSTSPARRWCSARRTAIGESCTCIFPRRAPRRAPAACEPPRGTMSELPELGVRAHGDLDPRSCIAIAEAAEAHGFSSLWFAENPFQRGLMPAASACAVTTRRVRIGLGIVNPYTRHPSLIAMEFAALDELAEGRARLGIGAGIGAQIARLGFEWRPLAAMRDTTHIVRALLAGEEVSYRGRVFSVDRAKLRFRPASPQTPIYMAAMGDRSLALCGEIADGLIVSNLCPPGYTERAVGIVARAAAVAGRPSPRVVQYVPCVARPDRDAARCAAVVAIGETLAALWPVGADWPALRETIVAKSGIPKA